MMKLSQPKSARIINICRVLGELRKKEGLSKAELSRILELNKVSCGEIVSDLEKQGIVKESDTKKIEVFNGRRPKALEIVGNSRFVLCVNIGSRNISVALCNLLSQVIKLERIPYNVNSRVEEFCANLLKSCIRTIKLVDKEKILGIGISIVGHISADEKTILSCPYLPWKNIDLADVFDKALGIKTLIASNVAALIAAEKIADPSLLLGSEPVLYVDWSDSISLAIVSSFKVCGINPDFGKIKILNQNTLEDACMPQIISGHTSIRLRDIWNSIPIESLGYMSKALNLAQQVTGAKTAVLSGDSASIDSSCLSRIKGGCLDLFVDKSKLGDNANIVAASEFALDRFFYQYTLLDEVRPWI